MNRLTEIVINTYHVCYIKLIITGLDYTLPSFARKILEQALTQSSIVSGRLYATQFMLVLLRARLPDFEVWGIPLLIKQTMAKKKSIIIASMEILDEACNEKVSFLSIFFFYNYTMRMCLQYYIINIDEYLCQMV